MAGARRCSSAPASYFATMPLASWIHRPKRSCWRVFSSSSSSCATYASASRNGLSSSSAGNEAVLGVRRLDEARADPLVPDAARVRAGPRADRDRRERVRRVLRLAEAGEQVSVSSLFPLSQLVDAEELQRGALVLIDVRVRLAVAEREGRAARERPALVAVVPLRGRAAEPLVRSRHDRVRLVQVTERPAQDERRVAGDVDVLQRRHQQRRAFPAARRAPVERLAAVEREELRLLRRRVLRDEDTRIVPCLGGTNDADGFADARELARGERDVHPLRRSGARRCASGRVCRARGAYLMICFVSGSRPCFRSVA
jgi:hypothetical protein